MIAADGTSRYELDDAPRDLTSDAPGPASAPDRVNRALILAVLAAVGAILLALGYMGYVSLARPAVPRTSIERRVMMLGAEVARDPGNAEAWVGYVSGLAASGQRAAALRAIGSALRALEDDSPVLALRAQLEHQAGNDATALETASETVTAALAYRKQRLEDMRRKGVVPAPEPSEAIIDAELVVAEIRLTRGEYAAAVKACTAALQENPTMADVLAMRGDARARSGDRKGASKDYRSALQYDPGNLEAVTGLRAIGEPE